MTITRADLAVTSANPHFIGSWQIDPASLCEDLIGFFEAHPQHQAQGKVAGGLQPEAKKSVDLTIRPRELTGEDHQPVRDYLDSLYECYRDYIEQWPFLGDILPEVELSSFNIQRYEAGGHFLKLHSERTTLASSHRVLAWMTYLNDVSDGGATRFAHQNLSIQPSRGRTLIWPAEWTHAHQGEVLNTGVKYIITGWFHFPSRAAKAGVLNDSE